jgi:hypothetical protein
MSILNGFDASTVPDTQPADTGLIPEGEYRVEITDTEEKPTKSGNGAYLQIEFTILDGSYASRKIWSRLNLDNPNEKAVEIARRDLAAICRAVGLLQPKSIVQFINKRLTIVVKHKPGRGEYGPTAEIVRYLAWAHPHAQEGASARKPQDVFKPARTAPGTLLESLPDDLPF